MLSALPTDPLFYATAVPAVILVGLSKGGLGGATALIGVPLMALTMPPFQAAAIMLPILIVMDMVSLWTWRGWRDAMTLRIMLPGALAGIALGWVLAAWLTAPAVRFGIGIMAGLFALRWFWTKFRGTERARAPNRLRGAAWGTVSGLTSFVAHAGGPPFQIYALPLKLDPRLYTGTSVIYFSVVNAVKVIPYLALGQFDSSNMAASAVLLPLAPLATLTGAWAVRRLNAETFYLISYAMMAVVAVKLVWDGIADLL